MDELTALQGRELPAESFGRVARADGGARYSLRSADDRRILNIDTDNINYTWDLYEDGAPFDWDAFRREFTVIWNTANRILKIRDTRRIGFVVEHRDKVQHDQASETLRSALTRLAETAGFAEKFNLSFETRFPVGATERPSDVGNDFVNVIYQLYDGALDSQHAEANTVNLNIDVQRYFSAPPRDAIPDELLKLYNNEFLPRQRRFKALMSQLGATNAQAA